MKTDERTSGHVKTRANAPILDLPRKERVVVDRWPAPPGAPRKLEDIPQEWRKPARPPTRMTEDV
jgi:hypothetical protein